MSVRRMLTIARKEFRHIARDSRLFFLVLVSPAFLLLTLSNVFALDVKHVMLAVVDYDQSQLSRRYLTTLTSDGELIVQTFVDNYEDIESLLMEGTIDAALVIPPDFSETLLSGRTTQVQAVINGTETIAAIHAVGGLSARSSAFAASLPTQHYHAAAVTLDVRTRAWYNPTLKSLVSMVPGLIAIVLCLPALAATLALAREKEVGTFEGLIATPVKGVEYLLGKLLAYMSSGLVSALLAVLVAVGWFHVPLRGSLFTFLLLTGAYFIASMGLSLLIAHFVSSQQTAMFVALMVFFVPGFFLAGLILPVNNAPLRARLTSYSLPTTHFVTICRGVFLKGLGIADLLSPTLTLLGMGGVAILLSILLFKKRLT